MQRLAQILFIALVSLVMPALNAETIIKSHGIAMHGQVKYPADFTHFDYVNPQAPVSGELKQSTIGTFDTFNSFIPRGVAAAGIGLIYDSLLSRSPEEPFSLYGLIAESVEYPEDRSWIIFHLNPKARFHDGQPITSEDVVFTFNTLIEKGAPRFSFYYGDVKSVEALGPRKVKFELKNNLNKEMILILGELSILPKHYYDEHEFDAVNLDIPLGSGPYKVKSFQPNRRITYERVDDYWAESLPVNRGRHNFERIIYDYYGDRDIAFEALRGGQFNFFQENNSKRWATQYQGKLFDQGKLIKKLESHTEPQGMQGFIFNLRNPLLQDIELRQAINLAFDFEWSNQNLFYGQYKRSQSFFENSELAAHELPSPAELALLTPFKDQLPQEVFNQVYKAPVSEGTGRPRTNLIAAQERLQSAGYTLKNNQLYSPQGQAVKLEFLTYSPAYLRILLPFKNNLSALGIELDIRRVDVTQYIQRMREFDYDMMVVVFAQSTSPGNEQRNYWHSDAAHQPSSRNYIGIENPVVDALVDAIIQAESREDLITASRALDRVLLWHHYLVPNFYIDAYRLVYADSLHYKAIPPYGLDLMSWWYEEPDSSSQANDTLQNQEQQP